MKLDEKPPLHVYPLFGRLHKTEGEECWCAPTTEWVNGTRIIVHREDN